MANTEEITAKHWTVCYCMCRC